MRYATSLLVILLVTMGTGLSQAMAEELHQITGFRSAHFGMTPTQVRAAIHTDFGVLTQIHPVTDEQQHTRELQLQLPTLSPGPGPARVSYKFDTETQILERIHVFWVTGDNPTSEQRDAMGIAGMQLARYFSALNWKPEGAITGVSMKAGEVLTFAGVDPSDAGVQVIVSGVPTTDSNGKTTTPEGRAQLLVSYMAYYGTADK